MELYVLYIYKIIVTNVCAKKEYSLNHFL